MMAELIRTSMFCDMNDILTDDDLQFLVNLEHTCSDESVVPYCPSPCNQDSYNSLEFIVRATDSVGDHLSDLSSSMSSESHIASPPSHPLPTPQQPTQPLPLPQQTIAQPASPTCNGTIPSIATCEEFFSRIKQASRVALSTFNSVSPEDIFGNNYLQNIVEYENELKEVEYEQELKEVEYEHALKEVVNEHALKGVTNEYAQEKESQPDCVNYVPTRSVSSYTKDRPPYTYAAMAVSAIYVSGKDCLSVDEIVDQLYVMFNELNHISIRKFRKAINKVLKTNKMFKKVKSDLDCYSVVPGRHGKNVFVRQTCFCPESRDKYSMLIHHHLGVPSMLVYLGIIIGPETSRTKLSRPTSHREKLPVVADLLKYRNAAVLVEGRSMSEKRKFNEYINTSNKRTNLELPIRPCFHDDADNDDDELLKPLDALNNSRKEEDSSARCHNSACMETNSSAASHNSACMENVSLDVSYTDFEKGLHSTVEVADPVVIHSSSSVKPTQLYTTPAPALVQSACQNYYIPYVGTVQLVDVFINGQTVKVPVQRMFM